MKTVDFYFDFLSPYAYLAATQIPLLIDRHSSRAVFTAHAIDMWAARVAAGNTGPSNREIPRKAAVLMADVSRWAKRYKIPLAQPKVFDMQRLNKAFWAADAQGGGIPFMVSAFRMTWGEGGDPTSVELIKAAASEAGLNPSQVYADSAEAGIATCYETENAKAQERGIFGAPFFIVGKEIFWGNDRIGFVEEELYRRGTHEDLPLRY